MKKQVLILGSSGMLGHVVNLRLRSLHDLFHVTDVSRNNDGFKSDIMMDVTDFDALKKLVETQKPDIIINCVGVLNNNAEINPSNAILINSYLPHFLAKVTETTKSRVIQISTDCVFSGLNGNYNENALMDAKGYYGRSKALGEIINDKDLTIRTSIVGPELHTKGIGLFQWFASSQGNIQGYSNVFWTGVTTIELSSAIVAFINEGTTGLYHFVNGVKISKFDLLRHFRSVFTKSGVDDIIPNNRDHIDKSLVNTRTDFSYMAPSYQKMILDMKKWIIENSNIYPHYQSIV